eukprot:TRINITY_DN3250_c0_g1_i1.p1 TRINITY_DN3250_c0_g1~~TRINITY_DN3250_c0_g1_i1.p1  ORF type:complete len:382 (+),score=112.43 TRINITY_DN3250_c0_g1_i1:51-1196(+)
MSDDELSSGSSTEEEQGVIEDYDHAAIPPPFRAYIGGLPYSTGTKQLTDFLMKHDDKVSHICVAKSGLDGKCKGFAHCSFSTESMRQRAIANLSGTTFNGRKIRVEEAGDHFLVKRDRDDSGNAVLKRPKREIAAQEARCEDQRQWAEAAAPARIQQGTLKRWEPQAKSSRLQELERQKAAAVAAENYEEAGRIKKLIDQDQEIEKVREKKKQAVEREDYGEAERLKKLIEKMENGELTPGATPPPAAAPPAASAAAPVKKAAKKPAKKASAAADKFPESECRRCKAGKVCSRHNKNIPTPAAAAAEATTSTPTPTPTPAPAQAGAACKKCMLGKPCAKHGTAEKKPKKPAAKPAAPKTMEEIMAGSGQSSTFMAAMNEDI